MCCSERVLQVDCVCQENVELERQLRAELAEAEGQLTQKVGMTIIL